ncbi:PKD domain-containing protein [Hyalangium gracile]|uniref:PKD domain-containing protein n=1 Tax=Hyalangium gracile TaxID=394092 RepID=UPI001CCDC4E0|nr:PKD domain-containing protein [Hyalangium gracile]
MRSFAALVLGPILALQGCTKEEPQPPATTTTQARALNTAAVVNYQKAQVPIEWRTFTGTSLALGDDSVGSFTSPFPIPFAGATNLTSVRASMNGAITFDNVTSLAFDNAALPYATRSTLVAPFWDDLYPGPNTASNVFWGVLGTAPNRELVVEWRNVHHRDTRTATPANTLTFQVVFFEGTEDVLFNYKDVLVGSATQDKGLSATVGVQNSSTQANQHSFKTASLADETAYLWRWFTPSQAPVVGAVTINPTSVNEGDTLTVETSFTDADAADAPWAVQVDTDYGTRFSTDFAATSPTQGPVSVSGVVRTSGNTTVGVRVLDSGNMASSVSTVPLTVADVPPAAAPITLSAAVRERIAVTLASSFTDPGLDAPWKAEWDFDYDGTTFAPDAESTANTPGPLSQDHTFANDGTFTVALRITDKDGVQGALQTLEVTVADLAPSVSGIFGGTELNEGSPIDLSAVFTDPGDHSKPWKIQWDLDYRDDTFDVDEETETETPGTVSLNREARDSGALTYALRIVDADGSSSPVKVIAMQIAEANPVLDELHATLLSGDGKEPSTVTFDLSAFSGADKEGADPIRGFLWDFDGDGAFDYSSSAPIALHTYRDNKAGGGAFTARVRVFDEDTFSETQVDVAIQNVAPTLTIPTTASAQEGSVMALRATATDPGNDVLSLSVSGAPAGLTHTADGLLLWTPSFQQTSLAGRPYTFTVTVTDDDGGSASTTVTVTALSKDSDHDGMADTWEQANGLDASVDDASGDVDGDGVSNLAEYLDENGGPRLPSAAVASTPLTGTQVSAPQIVLTAQNVADRGDLTDVQYQFQVFSDAALTALVRDVTVDQSTTGTTTSTTITDGKESPTLADLDDDHLYVWRVRAVGMKGPDALRGPWSAAQRITFNPSNDAPAAPFPAQPLSGTQVSTSKPMLVADNALDVDDTELTYTFDLAEDAAMSVALTSSPAIPAGAKGSTAWVVTSPLKPFATYYWRVTATDPHGARTQSEVSSFTVYIGRPSNTEPAIPALSAPSNNGTVGSLTPELVASAATDADGDALSYIIEVDTSPTFTSPNRQASPVVQAGQDGKVRWQPAALLEDQRYYWRARAQDPYSSSDWTVGSFVVNAQNNAPNAPVALNPSDAILYNRRPTLLIQNSTDPEGDAITYAFEVRNADGQVVASGNVPAGGNGHTSFSVTQELDEGAEYVWVARAKDAANAVSAASAEARFQVYKAPEMPKPDDGGCSTGAGALGGLLPLIAMALGMLRRRRS